MGWEFSTAVIGRARRVPSWVSEKRTDYIHGHMTIERAYRVSQAQRIKALSIEIKAGRSITVRTKALSETIQYKYQSLSVI